MSRTFPLICLPLSTAPGHTFSWVSAASLGRMFMLPSTIVPSFSTFFSLCAPVPPPFTYPPSSAAPRCAFLPLSTALLRHAFAPPFTTGFRTSAKQSSGATITSHILFRDSPAHSILGLPASCSTWWKKRNNYLTFFMFVLLTSICQYLSKIVLFCWVQNSDSSASQYQTTRFLPFVVYDCVCNQPPKLPNWRWVRSWQCDCDRSNTWGYWWFWGWAVCAGGHQQNKTYLIPLITSYSLLKPLILGVRRG